MGAGVHDVFSIVDLEQGTPAWLDWRRQGVGASDAPTIMGENPWKSREQLLREKLSGSTRTPNAAMVRGTALEPMARQRYEQVTGIRVAPACLQSSRYEWQKASTDGLSSDRKSVVEIKCGERVYEHSSSRRRVPDHYVGQLQHILAVTGLPAMDFWCWMPERSEVHLRVSRDDRYIERLIATEQEFWFQLTRLRK